MLGLAFLLKGGVVQDVFHRKGLELIPCWTNFYLAKGSRYSGWVDFGEGLSAKGARGKGRLFPVELKVLVL